MSLSQRVRDIRYSKGWGPDELANRAEISRTALYQIESGKTGLPRAGTLRRIAVALEVPMEDLLGHEDGGAESPSIVRPAGEFAPIARSVRLGSVGRRTAVASSCQCLQNHVGQRIGRYALQDGVIDSGQDQWP